LAAAIAVVALTALALAALAGVLQLAGRLTGRVHVLVLLCLLALTHPRLPVTPRQAAASSIKTLRIRGRFLASPPPSKPA